MSDGWRSTGAAGKCFGNPATVGQKNRKSIILPRYYFLPRLQILVVSSRLENADEHQFIRISRKVAKNLLLYVYQRFFTAKKSPKRVCGPGPRSLITTLAPKDPQVGWGGGQLSLFPTSSTVFDDVGVPFLAPSTSRLWAPSVLYDVTLPRYSLSTLATRPIVAVFGDSRRFRWQIIVAEIGDYSCQCGQAKPKTATVAVFGDSRRFRPQCGQGFTKLIL